MTHHEPPPAPFALGRRQLMGGGLVVLLAGAGWLGARGKGALIRVAHPAMGTLAEVLISHPGAGAAAALARAALEEISAVERRMTRFNTTSEVGRVNAHPGRWFPVSPATAEVVRAAQEIAAASDGRFHPALGALGELWGFFDHRSGRRPPAAGAVGAALADAARATVELGGAPGAPRLRIAPGGARMDLGAIAKGYAVDRAVGRLRAAGVSHALVNLGGDLYALGNHPQGRPWQVGIRHPRREGTFLAVLALTDRAVATSGDYENFFVAEGRRFHHLLEPATGRPAPFHQSVTVTGPSVMVADALATAAFATPPPEARRLLNRTSPGGWITVDGRGATTRASPA